MQQPHAHQPVCNLNISYADSYDNCSLLPYLKAIATSYHVAPMFCAANYLKILHPTDTINPSDWLVIVDRLRGRCYQAIQLSSLRCSRVYILSCGFFYIFCWPPGLVFLSTWLGFSSDHHRRSHIGTRNNTWVSWSWAGWLPGW